jgi:hypothetical protein
MRGVQDIRYRSRPLTTTHEFELLCSRSSGVELNAEQKIDDRLTDDNLFACPDNRPAMTGITMGKHSTEPASLCATTQPDLPGKSGFDQYCSKCHGADGSVQPKKRWLFLPTYGDQLTSDRVQEETDTDLAASFIGKHHGGSSVEMRLSAKEIDDVTAYIRTFKLTFKFSKQ